MKHSTAEDDMKRLDWLSKGGDDRLEDVRGHWNNCEECHSLRQAIDHTRKLQEESHD